MKNDLKAVGDLMARLAVIRSFFGVTYPHVWVFIVFRTFLIPLKKFHEILPKQGVLVEIGSGHGIICQYLLRRSPKRIMLGYDIDLKRTDLAIKATKYLNNISFKSQEFEEINDKRLSAIIIIGVFCLLNDTSVTKTFDLISKSLKPGDTLFIHDIPKKKNKDWIQKLHLMREKFLSSIGFTKGEGLFIRDRQWWNELLLSKNFTDPRFINAPVIFHSTFNLLSRLKSH